jgi:hypothetical protein
MGLIKVLCVSPLFRQILYINKCDYESTLINFKGPFAMEPLVDIFTKLLLYECFEVLILFTFIQCNGFFTEGNIYTYICMNILYSICMCVCYTLNSV